MKSVHHLRGGGGRGSHPARGAWIEMPMLVTRAEADVSHPARGAWIEISAIRRPSTATSSHPARGAWIEIMRVYPGDKGF